MAMRSSWIKIALWLVLTALVSQGVYAASMVHSAPADTASMGMSVDEPCHDEEVSSGSSEACDMASCQCATSSCRLPPIASAGLSSLTGLTQHWAVFRPSHYRHPHLSQQGRPPNA